MLLNISIGAVAIPLKEVCLSIFGSGATKSSWEYIIMDYRLPKAIVAILVGMGLAISGLLMQTLFRNPLAGPYVLGLSSGASLGVALVILGSAFLPAFASEFILSSYGIVLASSLGSFLVLLAVLAVAQRLRDTMAILIVGLMFGSLTNALVGTLTYFSTAEQLQKFTFWSLGTLGNLSWTSITILSVCVAVGLILSLVSIKPLNSLLLGENYATNLGINFYKNRFYLILISSALTGLTTAFCGPIAFIGIAIPIVSRLIFKTSKQQVHLFSCILIGSSTLLISDAISNSIFNSISLPINIITTFIGAPLVIYLMFKTKHW